MLNSEEEALCMILNSFKEDYNYMIKMLNGDINEKEALYMILNSLPKEENTDMTNIAKKLENFGFTPISLQKETNDSYNFKSIYDNISSAVENMKKNYNNVLYVAVSYTQQPREDGNKSMPDALKQECNKKLIIVEQNFQASATAVWFDKLAMKQAKNAQLYWAITSNIMFLTLPVLSLVPRCDHYILNKEPNSTDTYRLRMAGIHDILVNHTKCIAECTECWLKTHSACMKKCNKNMNTMKHGGMWIDGWLRCWPEVERRLGSIYKGTYVCANDYLLILDTYMFISNVAKELHTNDNRDIKWFTELAWLQAKSSERNENINENSWCTLCKTRLKEDITKKDSKVHEKHWKYTIELLQAIRESLKYITPLRNSSKCCDMDCQWNATLDAYGKFNNSGMFGRRHPNPKELYVELLEEYRTAKSIKFHELYRVVSHIAYGTPGQAPCYKEGDKMGAIIALMNFSILSRFIEDAKDNSNLYKKLMLSEQDDNNTGLCCRNLLPLQLYRQRGIYDHAIIVETTNFWLGSLQTDIKQSASALKEFLVDIGINEDKDINNIIKRAQYEAVRQINAIGSIHIFKDDESIHIFKDDNTIVTTCPGCIRSQSSSWVSYKVVALINPMVQCILAENNIGGLWHNMKLVVYDDHIVGHGNASISEIKETLTYCENQNKHKFLRAVVSFGNFDNHTALIELMQCNIENNAILKEKIQLESDVHFGKVINEILERTK